MAEPFDAYAEWLQIAARAGRPNHYELLGLRLFEADPERIRSCYWERFERVRKYEVGHFSEQALPLLEELSQAFQCLSDPAQKRGYDESLRRDLAAAGTLPGVTETISDVAPQRASPLSAPSVKATPLLRAEAIPNSPTDQRGSVGVRVAQGPIPAIVTSRPVSKTAAGSEGQTGATWSPPLVIGGAIGAVAVLSFCIAMLKFGLGSNDAPEPAATERAKQQAEPKGAPDSRSIAKEPGPAKQPPGSGVAGEWTGVLEKVLAVRDAAANPGGGAVHLVVKVDDPKDGWSMIDAAVPDLAFLREIADYRSAQDSDEDHVVVSGISTDKLHQDKRVYAEGPLPVVELKSLRKIDGSAPVLVGGRRNLSLSPEAVDVAAALRTLDEQVRFNAVVGDQRDSTHFLVQVDELDRQAAVAWSGLSGLPSGETLRAGQPLHVTAKVTGESARFDPLEVAVLSSARIVLGAKPKDVAGSGAPSAPSSAPAPNTPAEPPMPSAKAGSPQLVFQVKAHRTSGAAVSWSPNGGLLATSGSDGLVRIWIAENGAQRQEINQSSIDSIHWSPDGQWLVGSGGRTLRGMWGLGAVAVPDVNRSMNGAYSRVAWNRVTGQAAFVNSSAFWLVLPPSAGASIPRGSGPTLNSFDFSPDGRQIAVAVTVNFNTHSVYVLPFFDFVRRVWDAGIRFDVRDTADHLEFREDPATGIHRVAVYIDREVHIYRLENGLSAEEMMIDTSRYFSGDGQEVSLSDDGRRLAYVSGSEVHVKEARGGGLPNSITINVPRYAQAIAFAPDSIHLAVGQSGNEVLVWDCAANRETAKITAPAATYRLDWRRDAQRLAAVHSGGELTVWDLSSVVPKFTPAAPQAAGVESVDLLEFYALSGAWEEYHKLLKTVGARKLTKEEETALGGIKRSVNQRVDHYLAEIGVLKKRFPRMKAAPPEVIGRYQFVLKEIIAIDPEKTQSKRNLAESIEESGEVAYTPP